KHAVGADAADAMRVLLREAHAPVVAHDDGAGTAEVGARRGAAVAGRVALALLAGARDRGDRSVLDLADAMGRRVLGEVDDAVAAERDARGEAELRQRRGAAVTGAAHLSGAGDRARDRADGVRDALPAVAEIQDAVIGV